MRKVFVFLFISFSFLGFGQEYKLFHSGSILLYTSDTLPKPTFGIAFDSVHLSGTDSIYFNYTFMRWELFQSDTCEFWPGNSCYPQEIPSWIGKKAIYDNVGKYSFITSDNDTIILDFNTLIGDSLSFYEDAEQQFFMIANGIDTSTILDVFDSVRSYSIAHYDYLGNTINSPLNGKIIAVGKNIGLIDFFRIDSFPDVLEAVSLIGHIGYSSGLIALTNEVVYDHQPGDIIQYHDFKIRWDGPPWENYNNYVTHTFIERWDTQDSIIYLVERLTYNTDSVHLMLDTIKLKYKKDKIIAQAPFNKINQAHILITSRFYKPEYCGLPLWTYQAIPEYLVYCEWDNCWGPYDIPGPPPSEEEKYVCGLGLYLDRSSIFAPPPEGYTFYRGIVYFMKNDVECGNQVIVNIENPLFSESEILIYPNPARDKFEVWSLELGVELIEVYDLTGKKLIEKHIPAGNNNIEVDVSGIEPGMYICRIMAEGIYLSKKIVIQ